jgi:cytoskeletal protein RodZ
MQADKEDKLSKVIKNKLEGYEKKPAPHVWEHIAGQISPSSKKKEGAALLFLRNHWHLVAAIAAAILLLLFVLSFAGDAGIMQQSPLEQNQGISENSETNNANTSSPSKAEEQKAHPAQHSSQAAKTTKASDRGTPAANETKPRQAGNITRVSAHDASRLLASADNKATAPTAKSGAPAHQLLSLAPQKASSNTRSGEVISPQPPVTKNWAFGFYATPEMLYSQAQASGNSPSLSADLAVMYRVNNYFIQSGLSLGSSNDNSNANINFLQTEFLGSYQDVYNVTFDTTGGGEPQPIYHTQQVDIYDTTEHYTTTAYTNSYRYLSMPLLLGYKQNVSGKFSYSLKGGPVVSLMMSESESHSFNRQNAQIKAIYNKPADRVTTNWQMLMSVGIHYKLHNHIWFAVEPRMKYYFNPVYNTQAGLENNKPFALGVRTGVTVGF